MLSVLNTTRSSRKLSSAADLFSITKVMRHCGSAFSIALSSTRTLCSAADAIGTAMHEATTLNTIDAANARMPSPSTRTAHETVAACAREDNHRRATTVLNDCKELRWSVLFVEDRSHAIDLACRLIGARGQNVAELFRGVRIAFEHLEEERARDAQHRRRLLGGRGRRTNGLGQERELAEQGAASDHEAAAAIGVVCL